MPIYEVIQSVLEERGLGNKIRNYSYKNEGHFKELWGFDSSLSTGNIVIVWDDIPPETSGSPVRTKKYLTPIDWAVGFSLSIKEGIKQNTYPDLRILIVDVGSQPVSFSDSLKIVYQLCNKEIVSMPWIRIFSITASGSGRDIDAFYRTLEKPETLPSMKEALDAKTHDLDSVKGIWAASLTRPSTQGDHHAIANLVGPLLLMEEGGDIHVNALQTLMRSIGLLPDCKKGDENAKALLGKECSWVDWQEPEWQWKLNELLRNRNDKLNLILIDDMFQMGWGKILCRGTGVDYKEPSKDDGKDKLVKISDCNAVKNEKFVVKATSSAKWIFKKLETLTSTDNRFEFSLDGSVAAPEILFLDLRLYSGGNFEDEVAFFSELINFAKKFEERQNKNLPWPGFTNDELERIEVWIKNTDKKQEDSEYIDALTILPRILALTDLSLPIILFSATGRRGITEKLKPYGNIITVFEKPRFTVDIPFDIAWQTKKKFQEAFGKALSILQARQKCRTIIESGNVKAGETVLDFSKQKGIHIELFIDECLEETTEKLDKLPSGVNFPDTIREKVYYNANNKSLVFKKGEMKDDDLKVLLSLSNDKAYKSTVQRLSKRSREQDEVYVGGLFAIFSDAESIKGAREKADKFDDDLVRKGIRYFDSLGIGVQRNSSGIRNKGISSSADLNRIMSSNENENKPDSIGFIGLRHLLANDAKEVDLFNPRLADNLFRLALASLIELFLSETLPSLFNGIPDNQISISIYAATRIKPYKHNSPMFNEAKYRLGLDSFVTKEGKYCLYSINRDSIYPIVSDIISFHGIENRNLYRVAGVKLPYKKENTEFPEYFICRKCKGIVSIDPFRDIKEELIRGIPINVAKITGFALDRYKKKYAFIKTIETGETPQKVAIVLSRQCGNISNAKINDIVTYSTLKGDVKGKFSADDVRLLTDSEMTAYNAVEKKYSLYDINLECSCTSNESFSPDYRALHYIADEILNHIEDVYNGDNYGGSIKKVLGGFDDVLDDDLKSVIKASRYLDIGEIVSAIAYVKVTKDYKPNGYSVKPLLLQRIASNLDKLTGDEFSKLVQTKSRPTFPNNRRVAGPKNLRRNNTQKLTTSTQETTPVDQLQGAQKKNVEAESVSTKQPEKKTPERLEGTIKFLVFSVDFNSINGGKNRAQVRCNFINNIKNGQSVQIGYPKDRSGLYSAIMCILDEQQIVTAKEIKETFIASEPVIEYGSIEFQQKRYLFRKDDVSRDDLKELREGNRVSFALSKDTKGKDIVKDVKLLKN